MRTSDNTGHERAKQRNEGAGSRHSDQA